MSKNNYVEVLTHTDLHSFIDQINERLDDDGHWNVEYIELAHKGFHIAIMRYNNLGA